MTTAMFMYQTAFSFGDFGTASAISWLYFLRLPLAWANNKLFARSGMKDGI
jgi:multiple sugar transport system permease protein